MELAAVFRGFPADERSDQQWEFGPARQSCFDLSRSFEAVNRLHFCRKPFVAVIGLDLDHCIDTGICGVRLVRDQSAQASATTQRRQSGVEDSFGNLVHN
jgi:hypothetical protein